MGGARFRKGIGNQEKVKGRGAECGESKEAEDNYKDGGGSVFWPGFGEGRGAAQPRQDKPVIWRRDQTSTLVLRKSACLRSGWCGVVVRCAGGSR